MLGILAALTVMMAPVGDRTGASAQAQAQATQSLFVVIYRPGPAWIAGQPMEKQKLGGHVTYIRQLLAEGRLVAGGPFTDGNGGMAILRAANIAEARAILAADPAVTGGVFAADLRPWQPRFDSGRPLVY